MGSIGTRGNDKPGLGKRWSGRREGSVTDGQSGRQGLGGRRVDGVVRQARIRQRVNRVTDGELQKREKGYWRTGKTDWN